MKGQEGIIYIIGFLIALIMVVGALSVSLPLFGTVIGSSKKTEIQAKSNVYTAEYALKFARVYAKTALTYSVYQAMYDLGKKSGGSACELVKDKNEIEKNLKTEILKNLNGYTSGTNAFYSFMGKDVVLPHFSEPGMNITETASGMNVSTEGDRTIYLKETASHGVGGETIMVEISSKMENVYGFDFFSLHEKAIDVAGRIKGCTSTLNTKEGSYEIVATSDNATEPCTVTVKVTDTSKTFPIANGASIAFEPISMVFLVNFGKSCAPAGSAGKTLLLGDSLTMGYSPYLVNKPICPNVIFSDAEVSRTTAQMLDNITKNSDIAENGKYNTVVVLGGVNDIAGGASANDVISNLQKIHEEADKKKVHVVYLTLLPCKDSANWDATKQQKIDEVNTWLKGSGYDVIDAYEKTEEGDTDKLIAGYDAGDHLHLNSDGYKALAEYVGNELQSKWSLCQTPSGTGGTTTPPSGTTPPGGTTAPGLTLAGRTIVLDPGHGGGDPGALGPSGTNIVEREVNLQIARMIGAEMTNRGARVIYTRNDDSSLDLAARTAVANNNNADIFISIHANSDQNCNGVGTETFVYCLCSADAENNRVLDICNVGNCYSSNAMFQSSRQLAEDIQPLLVNTLGTADRGIRGADLGVLMDARMPAVLIETAFICNLQEANLLNDPTQQERIGEAITGSLEEFYGA